MPLIIREFEFQVFLVAGVFLLAYLLFLYSFIAFFCVCGGLSLAEVGALLSAHSCRVAVFHASESSADQFRQSAMLALSRADSSSAVVVNYHMSTLGQTPFCGHHSPLAAYHAESDRFLLLDVWPDTVECWATTDNLFAAMNTIDDDTAKTRGFCIVSF